MSIVTSTRRRRLRRSIAATCAAAGALLVIRAASAQGARGPEPPAKELDPAIHLPSGVSLDPATQERLEVSPRGLVRNFVHTLSSTFAGASEHAGPAVALWLVRAANAGAVESLRQRLEFAPPVTLLDQWQEGTFVIRADSATVESVAGWVETAWIGTFEWKLKLHPLLLAAREDLLRATPEGEQEVAALVRDGHSYEPSLPVEVWLFDQREEEAFLGRLERSLGRQRRSGDGGEIEIATVRIERAPEKLWPVAGSSAATWLRLERLPIRALDVVARDLAVARVVPAPLAQSFAMTDCLEEAIAKGFNPTRVLHRLPGIWPGDFDGAGELIAHADSGFDVEDPLWRNGDLTGVLARLDLDGDGTTQPAARGLLRNDRSWWDPTGHGTHTAGLVAGSGEKSGGRYCGVAPASRLLHHALADEAGSFRVDVRTMLESFEEAERHGARIHSDSWGLPSGTYHSISFALDGWTWNGGDPRRLLPVFAAGNTGPGMGTIASPGDSKNALAVGAVDTDQPERTARTSARGPAVDRRVKPELGAPGTWLVSTKPVEIPKLVEETIERNHWVPGRWQVWRIGDLPELWRATCQWSHTGSCSLTTAGGPAEPVDAVVWSPSFPPAAAGRISFWGRWDLTTAPDLEFSILWGDIGDVVKAEALPARNPTWPGWDRITLEPPASVSLFRSLVRVGFRVLGTNRADLGVSIDDFVVAPTRNDCGIVDLGLVHAGSLLADAYALDSGTSMATPLVAGLAARYRQFLRERLSLSDPTAITLKAALINGSTRPPGVRLPNSEIGFGLAGMELTERSTVVVVEEATETSEAADLLLEVEVSSTDEPLRATLAWWDPPANRLIHDLDLVLESPSGRTYPPAADRINTVEDVVLERPETGRWKIFVRSSVSIEVPFTLVVSGGIVADDLAYALFSP